MTTSTVALPGVSRLTRGVKIFPSLSLALDSMDASCEEGHANAIRPEALQ